jgi:hypothetical protein
MSKWDTPANASPVLQHTSPSSPQASEEKGREDLGPLINPSFEERYEALLARLGLAPASSDGAGSSKGPNIDAATLSMEDRNELFLLRKRLSNVASKMRNDSQLQRQRQRLLQARDRLPTVKEQKGPERDSEDRKRRNLEAVKRYQDRIQLGVQAVPLKRMGRARLHLRGVPEVVRRRRELSRIAERKMTKKKREQRESTGGC